VSVNETASPAEGIHFTPTQTAASWVILGKVDGASCIFGEFLFEGHRPTFSFAMLSVSGVELRGKIELIPIPVPVSNSNRQFAAAA
jgi:hypothetical protein